MKANGMTLEHVRGAGMTALFDALGPANALRFLQLFQPGSGDYTRERHAWLDNITLEEILADVQEFPSRGRPVPLERDDRIDGQ